MGKQALNQYHTSHHTRYDKSFKIMTQPSIPMFQTALSDVNKLNVMPAGDNIIKAIYAHPDNPEDGIVANENMIKSGKFRINKYTTHKLVIKRKSGSKSDPDKPDEVLAKPPVMLAGNERFHALDDSGLPIIGTYVKKGDCIIGRMRVYSRREGKDQNASLYVGIGEDGYIDRVSITSSKLGPVVKVKIFRARAPLVGDKYASRYSQKGTISLIVSPKLLPRVALGPNKGMVADLYVNPHAIPSRMPMGEILELLMSKAALITGRRVDATAFNDINVASAREVLAKQWDEYLATHPEERCQSHFKEDGTADDEANREEDMYRREHFASGYEFMEVPIRVIPPGGKKGDGPKHLVASGRYRPCRKPIYMGPCNTQCLKYQVLDKYQVRSFGALDPTTRQPIGGRAREGGQRFGEMERDALISHGATGIMLERLMHVSDEFECVICIRCGNFAIANMKTGVIKCLLDKTSTEKGSADKGEFGRITIPYVFKYLCHLLFLSSISVTFSAVPTQTFGTGENLLEDRYVT
jgi:DNA-directed RNA polymerase beta subunit